MRGRRYRGVLIGTLAFVAPTALAPAAWGFRGGMGARGGFAAGGPRGGVAVGPRGGTAVRGPAGGGAAVGPYGGAAVRGPSGAGAAVGPAGGAAVRGPGGAAAARGPAGNYAARGPGGYTRGYYSGGRYWRAPGWGAARATAYGGFYRGYPGWRYFGTVGLAPALASFAALSFLSTGMLIGSYAWHDETVYVYVVNDGEENKEYQVDSNGEVISEKVLPPTEDGAELSPP